MKQIEAFVRRSMVNALVDRLVDERAPGISIVEIHPVGYGLEPNYFDLEFSDTFKRYRHLEVVKVEVVCSDEDLERLLKSMSDTCRTGLSGDGMIFVVNVEHAIRIRDGVKGMVAL